VVIYRPHNYSTLGLIRERHRFCGNNVSLALQDKLVVKLYEFEITPCLGCLEDGSNVREVIKDSCRRLKTIVKQEQNPGIEEGATFRSRDDCGFIIQIVLGEVTDCGEDLIRLAAIDYVVSAPDFMCLWMRLECECRYDTEVVATTLEGCEEI
jgi:hypothetical protein